MACQIYGEWNGPRQGRGVARDTLTQFPLPQNSDYALGGQQSHLVPHTRYSPQHVLTPINYYSFTPICNWRIILIDTDLDNNGEIRWSKTWSSNTNFVVPQTNTAVFHVFKDFVNVRGNVDRPGQYDNYWHPHTFEVDFTADQWAFTCNQDLPQEYIVLLVQDN